MFFSRGNRKLPKTTAIFNLPHMTTCPGATEECKKYCYAAKAERMYKNTLPYRQRNYQASKEPTFVDEIVSELRRSRNITAVRIHESGDFYNQEYLNKWVEVASRMPNLVFTAYTKSLHLDFSAMLKLPNVVLFASIDPTTPPHMLLANQISAVATVIPKKATAPEGFFTCPGSCKSCNHCYTIGAGSVAFHQH